MQYFIFEGHHNEDTGGASGRNIGPFPSAVVATRAVKKLMKIAHGPRPSDYNDCIFHTLRTIAPNGQVRDVSWATPQRPGFDSFGNQIRFEDTSVPF